MCSKCLRSPVPGLGPRWGRDVHYPVPSMAEERCQLAFKPSQPGFMFNMRTYFSSPSSDAGDSCWVLEPPGKVSTTPQGVGASSVLA